MLRPSSENFTAFIRYRVEAGKALAKDCQDKKARRRANRVFLDSSQYDAHVLSWAMFWYTSGEYV